MVSKPALRDRTVCDERLTEVTRPPLNLMCKLTGNHSPAAKTGGTSWRSHQFEKETSPEKKTTYLSYC